MNPRELYTKRIQTLTDEIAQLNKHSRLVVVLKLSAIALAIGCIVVYTRWGNKTYTYRLSEGVARNQNATYLLKNILKSALGCVSKLG